VKGNDKRRKRRKRKNGWCSQWPDTRGAFM